MRYVCLAVLSLWSTEISATQGMRQSLADVFASEAANANISVKLLRAVCWVESRHKTRAINVLDGDAPSVGICQVKLATAKHMGYRGTAHGLRDPQINIKYAAKFLAHHMRRNNNNWRRAATAYNRGHFNAKTMRENNKYVILVALAMADGR